MPRVLPELPETFWAYLAGLVDGEGSMSVYANGPRLSISNTHLPTLEWVRDSLSYGRVWQLQQSEMATRPCYQWDCGARVMRALLPKILPYLRIKQERAEALLEYMDEINYNNTKGLPEEMKVRRAVLRESLQIRGHVRER